MEVDQVFENGWKLQKTLDDKIYYYNTITKVSQREAPSINHLKDDIIQLPGDDNINREFFQHLRCLGFYDKRKQNDFILSSSYLPDDSEPCPSSVMNYAESEGDIQAVLSKLNQLKEALQTTGTDDEWILSAKVLDYMMIEYLLSIFDLYRICDKSSFVHRSSSNINKGILLNNHIDNLKFLSAQCLALYSNIYPSLWLDFCSYSTVATTSNNDDAKDNHIDESPSLSSSPSSSSSSSSSKLKIMMVASKICLQNITYFSQLHVCQSEELRHVPTGAYVGFDERDIKDYHMTGMDISTAAVTVTISHNNNSSNNNNNNNNNRNDNNRGDDNNHANNKSESRNIDEDEEPDEMRQSMITYKNKKQQLKTTIEDIESKMMTYLMLIFQMYCREFPFFRYHSGSNNNNSGDNKCDTVDCSTRNLISHNSITSDDDSNSSSADIDILDTTIIEKNSHSHSSYSNSELFVGKFLSVLLDKFVNDDILHVSNDDVYMLSIKCIAALHRHYITAYTPPSTTISSSLLSSPSIFLKKFAEGLMLNSSSSSNTGFVQGFLHCLNDIGCPSHSGPETECLLLFTYELLLLEERIVIVYNGDENHHHFFHSSDIKILVDMTLRELYNIPAHDSHDLIIRDRYKDILRVIIALEMWLQAADRYKQDEIETFITIMN